MKKLITICACIIALAACTNTEQPKNVVQPTDNSDSLKSIITQKDNEINDLLSTLNEIQEGFREISAAENRLTLAKKGEGADQGAQIKQDIRFIAEQMKRNKELIAKLQKLSREGSVAAEQLKTTIDNLNTELIDKNSQLEQLRKELATKDVRITELDQTVATLNNDVASLKTETEQKTQTITNQDKQLNTAWYVFGTKKELQENHILDQGKVLQANFNKNYFTKIDIRVDKEVKLYSKSAKLLTTHPSSSYTLLPDATKQYVLRITNPQLFWSTSKYLVILVK